MPIPIRISAKLSTVFAKVEHSVSVSNVVLTNAVAAIVDLVHHCSSKRTCSRTFWKRNRRSVRNIYRELGKGYFRRAPYRMKYGTFKRLATGLRPCIIAAMGRTGTPRFIRNGQITLDFCLACALRWFAGGSAYDIMTTYSIGHTDTIKSVWYVLVDAVNRHPRFNIVYPDDHDTQRSIARGFQNASGSAGIDCCAGTVDEILIWTHKPSPNVVPPDCRSCGWWLWRMVPLMHHLHQP